MNFAEVAEVAFVNGKTNIKMPEIFFVNFKYFRTKMGTTMGDYNETLHQLWTFYYLFRYLLRVHGHHR